MYLQGDIDITEVLIQKRKDRIKLLQIFQMEAGLRVPELKKHLENMEDEDIVKGICICISKVMYTYVYVCLQIYIYTYSI
jgi:intergrase/recombinase